MGIKKSYFKYEFAKFPLNFFFLEQLISLQVNDAFKWTAYLKEIYIYIFGRFKWKCVVFLTLKRLWWSKHISAYDRSSFFILIIKKMYIFTDYKQAK